ncbi:hypothetical protein [Flavobacterium algicola]|nr:hypothetical protein [Flavobacterium algicola]MCG9791778.1 hypothetical protein [Flavobacterium algicola]
MGITRQNPEGSGAGRAVRYIFFGAEKAPKKDAATIPYAILCQQLEKGN